MSVIIPPSPPSPPSPLPSTVAVALYDYEALGEDGNLEFDEGDIVEVSVLKCSSVIQSCYTNVAFGQEKASFIINYIEVVLISGSPD